MANTIRIKRSSANATPTTLQNAELAFSEVSNGLFIGKGTGGANGSATSIEAIGGKGYFLALADSQTVTGDKTFSGVVDVTGDLKLDGTTISASAAEINKLSNVTAGLASAGKFLLVDSNKDLDLDGGDLTVQNLIVDGDLTVQGTVTSINSTTVEIADRAIELAVTATPTDTTADQGGIIVKGATDKSFLFDNSSSSFKSSENLNLASGKVVKINGTEVLSSSALGSGVTGSSLTSVGTISAGTWQGSAVGIAHGGTGEVSALAALNALSQVSGATAGHVLTKVGSDAVWAAPADTGISSLNGLTSDSQTFAVGTSGTDFNISSASGVHTFNIPSASATNRGLVTTSAQTFAGPKTFQAAASTQVPVTIKMASGQSVNVFRVLTDASAPVLTVNQFGQISSNTHFVAPGAGTDPCFVAVQAAGGQTGNLMEFRNSAQTAVVGAIDKDGNFAVGGYKGQTIAVAYGGTGATTAAGARSNLDAQQAGANLEAIRALTSAANKVPYFTGSGSAAVADLTSFGRDLIGSADAAAVHALLNLEPGIDVQAQNARLQAIADLSGSFSAGVVNLVGYSATNTAEFVESSSFGRSLLSQASASSARTALGVSIGVDVQAQDAELSAIAGLASSADTFPYFTGSGTAALATVTSFGRSILEEADSTSVRTILELESMALQPSDDIDVTGGSMSGVSISGGSISNVEVDGGTF